jgi:hypothetical protein
MTLASEHEGKERWNGYSVSLVVTSDMSSRTRRPGQATGDDKQKVCYICWIFASYTKSSTSTRSAHVPYSTKAILVLLLLSVRPTVEVTWLVVV